MHTSTLRAAGGSIAVTIAQSLAKSTGMHPGEGAIQSDVQQSQSIGVRARVLGGDCWQVHRPAAKIVIRPQSRYSTPVRIAPPGDKVSFEFDAVRLIISPVSRRKYSLRELLAMQGDAPLLIDEAWDAMPAAGQEVSV